MKYGVAQDDVFETSEPYQPPLRPKQRKTLTFSADNERIPPIHKPFKRAGCQWVGGIGWVWNPTGRELAS